MTAQPLFFEQVAPLDKARHQNWHVKPDSGFQFAAKANAVPVTLTELEKAAVEYPIVFLDEGQGPFPVAVLGLKPEQNLMLGSEGRWDGRYVPAYVRMYPFTLAKTGDGGNYAVCLDAAYAGFNETEGEPLFQEDGSQSTFLDKAVAFLKEYQIQRERTAGVGLQLKQLDLLQPMQANVELRDGEKLSLAGFLTVDREKISQLGEADLLALTRSGGFGAVTLHLASLNLFDRLVDRLANQDSASSSGANAVPAPAKKKPMAKPKTGAPTSKQGELES